MSNPTELPDLDGRTNGMTDSELIAYCQSHCETERALFNEDQVNRMIHLAGYPDWCVRKVTGWMSVHENMAKLCELALARRAQPEGEAPQAERSRVMRSLIEDAVANHASPEGYIKFAMSYFDKSAAPAAQHAESGAQAEGMGLYEVIEAAIAAHYPKMDSPHASVNDRIAAAQLNFRKGYKAALAAQQAAAPAGDKNG